MKSLFLAKLCLTIFFLTQNSVDADLIQSVCASTRSPDLCIATIKSDPRSKSDDIRVFSIIVLDNVLSNAGGGMKQKCPDSYKKLVKDVGDAENKLKTKQPLSSVYDSIINAIDDVDGCGGDYSQLVTLLHIANDVLNILRI